MIFQISVWTHFLSNMQHPDYFGCGNESLFNHSEPNAESDTVLHPLHTSHYGLLMSGTISKNKVSDLT